MREAAIATGDQAYGAVLVLEDRIVGWGPSRVVVDGNWDSHAERVAIWDAQERTGRMLLTGAVLYSTSIPCQACQRVASAVGIARMIHGTGGGEGTDAGPPLGG